MLLPTTWTHKTSWSGIIWNEIISTSTRGHSWQHLFKECLTNPDRKIPWRFLLLRNVSHNNQVEREDSEPCLSLNQGRSLPVHTIQGSISSEDLNAISFLWQCTNPHEVLPELIRKKPLQPSVLTITHCTNINIHDYIIKFTANHRWV